MGRIVRLSEKVVDTMIRALRAGGVLADDLSADAIRNVDNNATESELDAIAAGLNYGGLPGGGSLSSPDDVDVFLDNDANSDSVTRNFFRVSHNQAAVPVTSEEVEMMTLATRVTGIFLPGNPDQRGPRLIIGPRDILVSNRNHHASLALGVPFGSSTHYLDLSGGPEALGLNLTGGRIRVAEGSMALDVRDDLKVRDRTQNLKGGFEDLQNLSTFGPTFHVGDWENADSLAIETIVDSVFPAVNHYQIRTTDTTGYHNIYFRSSFTDDGIRLIVGGREGTALDSKASGAIDATVLIATPEIDDEITALHVKNTNTSGLASGTEMLKIEAEGPGVNYFFIRARRADQGNKFHVDLNGNVRADGTFACCSADAAEWVQVEGNEYDGPCLVHGIDFKTCDECRGFTG